MYRIFCCSTPRYEVRSIAERREVLEESEKEARVKVQTTMGELYTCRTKIAQVCVYDTGEWSVAVAGGVLVHIGYWVCMQGSTIVIGGRVGSRGYGLLN